MPHALKLLADGPRAAGPSPEEVVLWFHLRIYMKTVRALISRERANGTDRLAEDANGCAKLVLVSIGRSRASLTSALSAENGGEINDLIQALNDLECGIEERFPCARAYVRVGLDCPAA
jgi:hypothetical protein